MLPSTFNFFVNAKTIELSMLTIIFLLPFSIPKYIFPVEIFHIYIKSRIYFLVTAIAPSYLTFDHPEKLLCIYFLNFFIFGLLGSSRIPTTDTSLCTKTNLLFFISIITSSFSFNWPWSLVCSPTQDSQWISFHKSLPLPKNNFLSDIQSPHTLCQTIDEEKEPPNERNKHNNQHLLSWIYVCVCNCLIAFS